MKRSAWALVSLVVLAACAGGTEADVAGPQAPRAAVAEVFADVDEATPGCSAAVRHDGVTSELQIGLADLEAGTPITRDTIFDVGSVAKQFTAGVVALLGVRGELALDDDVTEFVPGVRADLGPITIADLLHHTSGLPDYIALLDADLDEPATMADALEVITSAEGAPTAPPGERFEYSNTNYVLLALVVEAVTGRSFPDVVETEVLEPLGMASAVVRDDQGVLLADQARGYAPEGDGWVEVGSAWRQTGDGALHASALELLQWAGLFLDEPVTDGDLGSAAWLDVMLTPGPVGDDGARYAGGVELQDGDRGPVISHGGSWIGYSAALVVEPASGAAVAVACNVDGDDAETRAAEVLELVAAG